MPSSAPHLSSPSFPTRRSSDLRTDQGQRIPGRLSIGWFAGDVRRSDRRHRDTAAAGSCDHSDGVGKDFRLVSFDQIATERIRGRRSEEHTSELQSPYDLVCRLLLRTSPHPLSLHDALPIFALIRGNGFRVVSPSAGLLAMLDAPIAATGTPPPLEVAIIPMASAKTFGLFPSIK